MVVKQYDVFWVTLDPALGSEIKKTRPCVVISPDEINQNVSTVIIAPLTSRSHHYPTRVSVKFQERDGWIVLDQIRTIDKRRLVKKMGKLDKETIRSMKEILKAMLVD